MATDEIFGASQRKNGSRKRDVCSPDITSVEAPKSKTIQAKTGSQYLVTAIIFISLSLLAHLSLGRGSKFRGDGQLAGHDEADIS